MPNVFTVSSGVTSTIITPTTAEYIVLSSGTLLVNAGGSETGAIVSAGGREVVSSGSATSDQIYGVLSVFSGAVSHLTGEIIENGGVFYEYNSAIVSNTVVSSGGTFILSGNTSGANSNTTLVSGGVVELITGKATIGGSLTFAGGNNVLFTSATIGAGYGDLAAITGFGATDRIEIATLQSGSSVSLGFASSGGNEVVAVLSGGSTVESFIFSGTTAYNSSDLVISTFTSGTNSGLVEIISGTPGTSTSGGVTYTSVTTSTTSAYVESAAQDLLILAGGVVSSATILASGGLIVNGGSETATSVALGGTETVSAGSAAGDQVAGALVVSGGAESSATISVGGAETVYGGAVSGDLIFGGATIDGGTVTSEVVESGGSLLVNAGATESGATLEAGANETVLGSAAGDQIYGVQLVSNGAAVVTGETVYAGGVIDNFLKGGIVSATTVLSGGQLNISGNAYATDDTLSGGALLTLQSPKANITGGLIFAGGFNVVEITGVTSPTFGDLAINSGFSSTDRIDLTSTAFTGSALSLTQTISGGNTVVTVTSGGSAVVETFIFAGTALDGYFTLLSDGHGGEDIAVPPVSVTTSVSAPTGSAYEETATNTLLVLSGGVVSSAQTDTGGFLTVNGGSESAADVLAGGLETIVAGSATGDQIYGSAIASGGSVTGETVFSGGQLDVAGGAAVGSITLSGGGVLDLSSPTAAVSATVTFDGGGNTLETTAVPAAGYGDLAILSGFSSADKIDVTGVALSGATLSFSSDGSGDSIATVSGGGVSESFLFSSPATYNSSSMSLISDGAGGVDLILDTTPVVTFTSFGGKTNKATTIVNGTVNTAVDPEAIGTTVTITEGADIVGTAVVGANGHWAANVAFLNTDGANVLTATDKDVAGNTGVTSQSLTYDVNTTAAEFTPGDLVISISGDGDGSGAYGDNAASPVTLEEITTGGAVVSQLVLPQTSYVVNGVTEYAISSEYGSQSEGSLELSADGHSLVIVGYGVNAETYNSAASTVYGGNALAQSTSVTGGPYVVVPRVVADINADGVIDTSTALTNVFNENNPRSVATVDGTSFWLSGQGLKGDTTQGVFYATDGATTATSINDATDTRTAEIYNGQLYISADTTQGATNISDYGALPTSATTPIVLTGLSNSVVLTAATANTANTAEIGQSVNLSPENFFFANNNTLYVADSGNPKNGGVGDGGLQKWVYNGTSWNLEYTLSAGLNLVPGTAAYGTSGLIGLAGKVVGDTVEFYATSYNLTDIEPTYVYAITDSLSATSGAGEQFSTIFTAAPGSNVRGIAFAPTPLGPTISGTVAGQTTTSEAPVQAFSGVTISDPNSNAVETLTITVGGAGGTLAGTGLTGGADGVYTLTGTAATVTSELDAVYFTAVTGQANTSSTASLGLSDLSSVNTTPVVDSTTTVIDTDPAVAPTITGTVAGQMTTSELAVTPFSGVTITDANAGANDTLTITVGGTGGVLTGTGLAGGAGGIYTLSGTAATVTSELDALSFTPNGQANASSTATLGLSDLSNAYGSATVDNTTTVIDTDPAVAPTITGTVAGQTTTSEAAVTPFSGVTITDANAGATDTLTITVGGTGGVLRGTGLSGGAGGVYTLTGGAATVTAELDALSFTPTGGQANTSSTATLSLSDESSAIATAATDGRTTVIDTDPAVAPTITGAIAGQTTTSEYPVRPFTAVTIADANAGGTETLSITVGGAGGALSGTGLKGGTGGIYTLTGTAAVVTSELDALSFRAKAGAPNTTSTSTFTLSDMSSAFSAATVNSVTTVIDTDPALASPLFEEISGGGVFSQSGNQYTLNLGTLLPGAASTIVHLGVINNVTGNADLLSGIFSNSVTSDFTLSGFNGFNGLGDGQAETAPTVTFSSGTSGTFSEVITLHPVSYNSTGYSTPLPLDVLTITGVVLTPITLKAGVDNITTTGVLLTAASRTLSAGDVITPGGSGNILDLAGGGVFNLSLPTSLTNVGVVNATEGSGSALPTITLRSGLNVDLTLASAPGGGGGAMVTGANDSSTINLGNGTDTVVLGSSSETVNGGAGADTYHITAATDGATINGGSGVGALVVDAGGTVAIGANITGVETVRLTSGTNFTANGLNLTITGSTSADTIHAGAGTEVITGGAGGDTLIAGSGADTFRDTAAHLTQDTIENFQAGDTIDITTLKGSARYPVTATWANGVLTVSEGSTHDRINLVGSYAGAFHVASDGAVGTDVTYTPPAAAGVFAQAISTFGPPNGGSLASLAQVNAGILQHSLHAATS
jgi:autotransporter passenger strand-loop-strand repeat protein